MLTPALASVVCTNANGSSDHNLLTHAHTHMLAGASIRAAGGRHCAGAHL